MDTVHSHDSHEQRLTVNPWKFSVTDPESISKRIMPREVPNPTKRYKKITVITSLSLVFEILMHMGTQI